MTFITMTVEDAVYASIVAVAVRDGVAPEQAAADLLQEGLRSRARLEGKALLADMRARSTNAPSDEDAMTIAAEEQEAARLERLALAIAIPDLVVRDARVSLDERQDGESVTRVMLLLDDPLSDSWNVERVIELRREIGRRATDLGLPVVSVTLVPLSEADLVEAFRG